jgi:hypothetical protein
MKLQIDNLDGNGVLDYSSAIDGLKPPQVVRKLNQAAELQCSLLADTPEFVAPANGARIILAKTNAQYVFTGYLSKPPTFEYVGWGERGPVYRYNLVALSDEAVLDRKRLPSRAPFAARSAGNALRQLTQDLLPGVFDTTGVQDVDVLASYVPDPQLTWSQHALVIALKVRGSYRAMNGALTFSPVGAAVYTLSETDANFSPGGLTLSPVDGLINDVTVVGEIEPQAYVKDYFVGDGLTLKFYLSQTPFRTTSLTLFDEEYTDPTPDATRWNVIDPAHAVTVNAGKLQVAGGTGTDGATTVTFVEEVELGGATVLQHGDVLLSSASTGVLGGLYAGSVSMAGCLAGFQITPNGMQSNIQALVHGAAVGSVLNTITGHHYVLTTHLYSLEIFRRQQTFHSAANPAGSGVGEAAVAADVRVVLEVHDLDPANPDSQITASTVLYDGVISSAPGYCTYALVNAANMQCTIAFTWLIEVADTEVRSALWEQAYNTQLVGALSDGAECTITSGPALDFFKPYVPAPNQSIEVRYRGRGRALTRVTNPASIAAQQNGADDGVRGVLRHVKEPMARTATDCENAALTILGGANAIAWAGEYDTWSDFLPGGAADIFPGDALQVNVPSRGAVFGAIIREVAIVVRDFAGEHSNYKISFADDNAKPLAFEFDSAKIANLPDVTAVINTQVAAIFLADLTAAELTQIGTTTVTVDAGIAPSTGGGIEVRWSDAGWGPANDRNLVGRFATQGFTIPRLSQAQGCYLRQYDASVPPKYSRYSAALYVNYPS